MSNNNNGIKDGILKGLKRILFTDTEAEQPAPTQPLAQQPAVPSPPVAAPVNSNFLNGEMAENGKAMKLRVYQLLESINKPGCDFFEVWNAAIEMGGAVPANIKAAFTSLKFADKSLTKEKLLSTGEFYINSLGKVLDAETLKRQQEKDKLIAQKDQEKKTLVAEISNLEAQIAALQQQLAHKRSQNEGINQKYQPQLESIDHLITNGKQSVNSVLLEMQQVVAIIQKEIN